MILALLAAGPSFFGGQAMAEAIPVELQKTDDGWQLRRNGKPYFIRGAGGSGASLEQLAAAGGNSVRTWGADDIDDLLDEAHARGLTVTVGIWLGHERHGFDYGDRRQVREQLERARELATLRALGMTPGQVGGLVTVQTGVIGLISGLAAVPLGIVMAWVLIKVINRRAFGWQIDMAVAPDILVTSVAFAIGAALLAGLYPAWRAGRSQPALAMREE